ncbi:hypothetical protein TWF696_006434 [Orbilia brochopaga]|uniref:Uncharacterized protein n=1 Tax=Orbilia brochopaga TaxID=3140254 RepID=A0AAV9UWC2_9PEZI
MKLSEYLDRAAAPDLRIYIWKTTPMSSSGTSLPTNLRGLPTDIVPWADFDDNIKKLLEPHLEKDDIDLTAKRLERQQSLDHLVGQKSTLVHLAIKRFEEPTKEILRTIFQINCYFEYPWPHLNIGDPDRIFAIRPDDRDKRERGKARPVFVYKTPWTLPMPDDVVQAFNEHKHDSENS